MRLLSLFQSKDSRVTKMMQFDYRTLNFTSNTYMEVIGYIGVKRMSCAEKCQFRSCLLQLEGDERHHTVLRKKFVFHVFKNYSQFRHILEGEYPL
jgi:hypothetical protein